MMFIYTILYITLLSMAEGSVVPEMLEIITMDVIHDEVEFQEELAEVISDDKNSIYFLPRNYNKDLKSPETKVNIIYSNEFLKKKPAANNIIPNILYDIIMYTQKKQDEVYNENIMNILSFILDVTEKTKLENDKRTSIENDKIGGEIEEPIELQNSEEEKQESDYNKYKNKKFDDKQFNFLNDLWNNRENVGDSELLRIKRRDNVIVEENLAPAVTEVKGIRSDTRLTNNLIFKNINF